jgi:prophage regulatory protein
MAKQVLRVRDVVEESGLSRTSIWRKEKIGTFPKRVRLGAGRAVGWRRSDPEDWLKGLGGQEGDQNGQM